MFRSIVICLPLTVFLLTVSFAEAQQPKKVPRIGLLFPGSQSAFAIWTEVFRQGPARAGYQRPKLSCLAIVSIGPAMSHSTR